MINMQAAQERKNHYVRSPRSTSKVEFSCLDYLMEDLRHGGIETVRIDLFDSVRQTELSFVYYVTLTLYVTAQDENNDAIFEYREDVASSTNTEPHCNDETAIQQGRERLAEVKQQLKTAGFEVLHGRYVEMV